MDEMESLSHTKWECKYHVVFIPKCRRKTLYGELRQHLGEVFRKLAVQKESRIEEGHRHLSRKLCLRDSCRGLETGLEYGIDLVKHGGDIPGQAFPSTLLERRNGKAQLQLYRLLRVEVTTTITPHDLQLAVD